MFVCFLISLYVVGLFCVFSRGNLYTRLLDILSVKRSIQMFITCGQVGRKEGNVLFNDALNTFYLLLYGVRHMVKDHSDSERGNPLLPHGLLFPISRKSFYISQTG